MSDKRLLARLKQRLRQRERPIRFVLAGAANTVFGLTLFPVLLWLSDYLHRHYMIGLVVSQAFSIVFAFLTYRMGVFRSQANIFREFWAFSTFYCASFALNLAALPILVQGAGIPPIPAQFGFSLAMMIGSYFWHTYVTFRAGESKA